MAEQKAPLGRSRKARNEHSLTKHNDAGAAYIAVMFSGITVFALLTAAVLLTMNSLQSTTIHASTNNAQTASDAGNAEALAAINECADYDGYNTNEINENQSYYWRMYHFDADSAADPDRVPEDVDELGVQSGCPTYDTTHILIESTGTGSDAMYDGFDFSAVRTYEFDAFEESGRSSYPFEHAIAAGEDFTANGYNIIVSEAGSGEPAEENTADISVQSGSFYCDSRTTLIEGSVIVKDPDSHSQIGNCENIEGSFYTAGDLHMSAGNAGIIIEGDLCVEGSVQTRGDTTVGDHIGGNWTVNAGEGGCNDFIEGTQGWIDYVPTTTTDDGETASNVVTASDGDKLCRNDTNVGGYDPKGQLGNLIEEDHGTDGLIVDLTDCSGRVDFNGDAMNNGISIRNDVTLIFDHFRFAGLDISSADGEDHHFNAIVPDYITPDNSNNAPIPHCDGRSDSGIDRTVMDENISGILYTPCSTGQITGEWRGQFYIGGGYSFSANDHLTYVPVAAPPGENDDTDSEAVGELASNTPVSYLER